MHRAFLLLAARSQMVLSVLRALSWLVVLAAALAPVQASANHSPWLHIAGLPGVTSTVAQATDPTQQRGLDEILAADAFHIRNGDQRTRDQAPVQWLRIDLRVPDALIGVDAWLLLTPALIGEALLYHPDGGVQRAGLSVPLGEQTHSGSPPHFYLRLDHPEMRVYLRVRTALPALTHVMLASDREMGLEILRDTLRKGVAAGACALMLLLAMINWFSTRDLVHRNFAFYIASFLLLYFFIDGQASMWLLPEQPELNTSLAAMSFGFMIAATIVFSVEILSLKTRLPQLATALKQIAMLLLGVSLLALEPQWVTPVSTLLWIAHFILGMLLLGVSLQQALALRTWQSWVLFTSFFAFTALEKTPVFVVLGWIPVYPWILAVPKLGLVIQLLLTHLHIVMSLKEQQNLKNETLAARMEAEAERAQRHGLMQFLAMFGHEARTPLAIIDSATQSLELLPGASVPEVQRRHQHIRAGVARLTHLCHDALSRERMEDSSWLPKRQPVPWPEWLEETLRLQEVVMDNAPPARLLHGTWLVAGRPCTLVMHGFDAPPPLSADPDMLRIAVGNLLDNARKYGDAGSTVHLKVEAVRGGGVQLCVCSQGPELSAQDRDNMFVKYWRRDEHNNVAGAGLGLPLVQQVAKAHGGTVEVQSHPDRWTCVAFFIPGGSA